MESKVIIGITVLAFVLLGIAVFMNTSESVTGNAVQEIFSCCDNAGSLRVRTTCLASERIANWSTCEPYTKCTSYCTSRGKVGYVNGINCVCEQPGPTIASYACCSDKGSLRVRGSCFSWETRAKWSECERYTQCSPWCTSKGFNSGNKSDYFCSCIGCVDTDGGANYGKKGTVIYTETIGSSTTAFSLPDSCESSSKLWENTCSGGVRLQTLVTCSSGKTCRDGACV